MTEEIKTEENTKTCECKKRLKDVFVIALGSFVGVYCALSLFGALHRPNFNHHRPMPHGMQHRMMPHEATKFDKQNPNNFEHFRNGENFKDVKKENLE